MKKTNAASSGFIVKCAGYFTVSVLLLLLSGCVSKQINIRQEALAKQRYNETILLFPPLSSNSRYNNIVHDLGKYYNVEIPKRMKGQVIYAHNIDSISHVDNVQAWNNLMKNGTVDIAEAAAIGKTMGAKSVLTCQILAINQYPPFRMVVQLEWIDTDSATVIGSLYQDVDLADSETNYRYKNFVGGGLAAQAYEQIFYSEDKYQTAYLMPQEFYRFVAAYSCEVLFSQTDEYPWWVFWRTVG